MTPRAYSRLETDDELMARVYAKTGRRDFVLSMSETKEQCAERHGLQRRIIWITPETETRR